MDIASKSNKKSFLLLDAQIIISILIIIIAVMLAIWRPWQSPQNRSITVTGESTLTDTPDEFVFNPSYTFKNPDQTAGLAALTQKSTDIVAKLKTLGVQDKQIKTNSGKSYDIGPLYIPQGDTKVYTLQITITLTDRAIAQKVQDYLVATTPDGPISPQVDFSNTKRKTVEDRARTAAEKDARQKAEQMAKNLGFSLGDIKSVTDQAGFGTIVPLASGKITSDNAGAQSLPIQPGENSLQYSVQVVYFIR